jgi:hypothetical protein
LWSVSRGWGAAVDECRAGASDVECVCRSERDAELERLRDCKRRGPSSGIGTQRIRWRPRPGCITSAQGQPRDPRGGDGLPRSAAGTVKPGTIPAGDRIPAEATDAERRAVTLALAQLGKPYAFGAAGPDSFDCSGLTMAAWAAAGIDLPHYTLAQYQSGVAVADASLHPGT